MMAEIGEVYLIGTPCNRRMNKSAETTKTDDQIPAASFVVAFPPCFACARIDRSHPPPIINYIRRDSWYMLLLGCC